MGKKQVKPILFRSELDALPIDEINTFEHRSVNKVSLTNVVTMATWLILCGLAMELHLRPETEP
jgi:hypothetical protein